MLHTLPGRSMSQAHVDALLEIYAKFALAIFRPAANCWPMTSSSSGRCLREIPSATPRRSRAQAGRVPGQWTSFRTVAKEFEQLDDGRVLIVAQQYAHGRRSGAAVHGKIYNVWSFAGDKAVRVEWRFDRERALAASGA